MKKSIVPLFVLILLAAACGGREGRGANGEPTETIAPASPQPAPTGTDAMTQTVDIEAGRSEAEGGGLTSPNPQVDTVTGGTTATSATAGTTGTTTQTTTR